MKKSSTAMAASNKNASQKLTIGLDLGDRSSWYCVLDEAGEVVLEQKVATTAKAMKEVFGGMPRSRIALETGTHSPWVSRVLSELGHEVIGDAAKAIDVLKAGEAYDKGTTDIHFVRGRAYLLNHQPAQAAQEFQTVLNLRGAYIGDPL